MTTQAETLIENYVDLLIIQYTTKRRAEDTIETAIRPIIIPQTSQQTLTASLVPDTGSVTFLYKMTQNTPTNESIEIGPIDWDFTAADIQDAFNNNPDFSGTIVVTGDWTDGFTFVLENTIGPVPLMVASQNTLESGVDPVSLTFTQLDIQTLPLAVENGFNVLGDNLAVGAQLDIIGKYVGVTRSGRGFTQQITLDDNEFMSLIRMAIIKNASSSTLAAIQELLFLFFEFDILAFDYQNMQMSYLISSSVGSQSLIEMFVVQGLLPKPMAVGVGVIIYAPTINSFFGFRTYEVEPVNISPFNTYTDYQTDWPWLSYANGIIF